jgi:hypothetical protein
LERRKGKRLRGNIGMAILTARFLVIVIKPEGSRENFLAVFETGGID